MAGGTVTLFDAAATFLPHHHGKYIQISGAFSSGNNTPVATAFGPLTYIDPTATNSRNALWWIVEGDVVGKGNGTSALAFNHTADAGGSKTIAKSTPTSGISTLTDLAGGFTSDMIGMPIVVSGSTSSKNNTTAIIQTVSGGGTIITYSEPTTAANETSSFSWDVKYVTLTASANSFVAGHSGFSIRIKNPTSLANNGAWVATYKSATQLNIPNINGVSETYAGPWALDGYDNRKDTDGNTHGSSHGWYIFGGRRNIAFEGCESRNVRTTCYKMSGSGAPLRDMSITNAYAKDCSAFFVGGADDTNEHTGFLIDDVTLLDNGTGRDGWNDGGCITFLGAKNITINNIKGHWTRPHIGAVDGTGVGLSNIITCSRYAVGQSTPVEDFTVTNCKFTCDSTISGGGNLFNTAISLSHVGLRAKYATAGALNKISATFLSSSQVNTGTDVITQTAAHGYATGDGPFRLTTSNTLPAPLALATDYYIIYVSATTYKLATSFANAIAGTAIDLTTTGTGTQTIISPNMTLTHNNGQLLGDEETTKQLVLVNYSGSGNNGTFTVLSVDSGGNILTYRNPSGTDAGSGGTYRIQRLNTDGARSASCTIRNNELHGVASNGIKTQYCDCPEVSDNIFNNFSGNYTTDGDAFTRFHNNRQINGSTTTAQIALGGTGTGSAQAFPAWPIIDNNTIGPSATGISLGARGFGVSVNGGSAYVDHPLLGKSGKVRPSQSQEEIVFAYGALPVDGDTLTLGGTTYTYKKTSPDETAGEFNTYDTDTGSNRSLMAAITATVSAGVYGAHNAVGTYLSASDYGTAYHDSTGSSFDVKTGHMRVRKVATTHSTDGTFNATSNALNPTFLVLLYNTNSNTSCKSKGAGSSASVSDKWPIWSPLAKYEGGAPNMVADNEACRALFGGDRKAIATIQCTTKANYTAGFSDFMTIPDGFTVPIRYYFDTIGAGGGTGTQVNISGATTAADVAAILLTAIQATQPYTFTAVNTGAGLLTLTHNHQGTGTNATVTENVANAGHTVSGFTGGCIGSYKKLTNTQAVAAHDEVDSGSCIVMQSGATLGTEEARFTF